MAYVDQAGGNRRALAIGSVALLHGAAIYALVTGLAVHAVKEITTILEARNIPIGVPEPDPAPTPPVRHEDKQVQHETTVTTFTLPPIGRSGDWTEDLNRPLLPLPVDPEPLPRPSPAFAPQAAAPVGSPAGWVTPNDYPSRDLREGNRGVTGFTVAIGASGRVETCTITASSGFASLDEATCRLITQRARFRPATDGEGRIVTGTWSSRVRWSIPEG